MREAKKLKYISIESAGEFTDLKWREKTWKSIGTVTRKKKKKQYMQWAHTQCQFIELLWIKILQANHKFGQQT